MAASLSVCSLLVPVAPKDFPASRLGVATSLSASAYCGTLAWDTGSCPSFEEAERGPKLGASWLFAEQTFSPVSDSTNKSCRALEELHSIGRVAYPYC